MRGNDDVIRNSRNNSELLISNFRCPTRCIGRLRKMREFQSLPCQKINERNTFFMLCWNVFFHNWHGLKESNLRKQFWRLPYYHYTKSTKFILDAGARFALASEGYEPSVLLLHYPASQGDDAGLEPTRERKVAPSVYALPLS